MGADKKKKVSKKSKRAWRKHTDIQDVEDFLEEKRSDHRLGVDNLASKKDSELFVLDTVCADHVGGKPRSRAEKREWAKTEPSSYELALIPTSAVQDPIIRNRVRSKEERRHPARKAKDEELKAKGLMRRKAAEAKKNRIESLKKLKKQRITDKIVKFDKDVWSNDVSSSVDDSWLSGDAKRQALKSCGEYKVHTPAGLSVPRSRLAKVETPHPGLSYNPSLTDHKELISDVVEKEVEMMKKDAHIARVSAPYKVKPNIKQDEEWVEEVLQGLGIPKKGDEIIVNEESEEEEDKSDVKPLVAPRPKMKTKKQRRAMKRLKEEARQRLYTAVEKRKTSDIYRLRKIVSDLDESHNKQEVKTSAKHKDKCEHAQIGTKRLARLKYEEPLQDFSTPWELSGSLRKLRPRSTLLRDRFFSMQKRNMLQPTNKIFKSRKRKVKVFVKRDHRLEEEITKKSRSAGKIKIINTG